MLDPKIDPRTNLFRIRPYFLGKRYTISLGTKVESDARLAAAQVEKRIWAIENGMMEIPSGADPITFIRAGTAGVHSGCKTLPQVIEAYRQATPDGSKAKTTRVTEEIHFKHLLGYFGTSIKLNQVTPEKVTRYVAKRLRDVAPQTVRKEIVTLRMLWGFGVQMKWVNGGSPTIGIRLPKSGTSEPYLTLSEIEKLAPNTKEEFLKDLWSRCVLVGEEISFILEHVKKIEAYPILYPMISTAFFTGMRRSELCRSLVSDWDIAGGSVRVRERKRVHSRSESYRQVDLHGDFIELIKAYLEDHPGGPYMFCEKAGEEISPDRADDLWDLATRKSRFSNVKGWHVCRHSFCSNLAGLGVSPALVMSYMGHQTEEQRARYTHFFPKERKKAIEGLNFLKRAKDGKRSPEPVSLRYH